MFIVIRKVAYGPFASVVEAFAWAEKEWPGEEHDVQALHAVSASIGNLDD